MKITFNEWLENNKVKSLSSLGITKETKMNELFTMIDVMRDLFRDDEGYMDLEEDHRKWYFENNGYDEVLWTEGMWFVESADIKNVNEKYEEIPGNKIGDENYKKWIDENVCSLTNLYYRLEEKYAHIVKNINETYDLDEFQELMENVDFKTLDLKNKYLREWWVNIPNTKQWEVKYEITDMLSLEKDFQIETQIENSIKR